MLHRAAATHPMLAADVGAGKGQFVTQKIGEILPAVHLSLYNFTVDDKFYLPQLHLQFRPKKSWQLTSTPHLGCFSIAKVASMSF